jgi:hypothetical protein
MKNLMLFFTLFISFSTLVEAQAPPQAFNYSAVARNPAGQPIASTTIGIQISILKTTSTGAVQYSENHFVNTDAFGLFNLVIGTGAVQSGSMATINWSNDNYYLKVGMDANGGTNFLTMGTTQLLSVPYAMHAKTAESLVGGSSSNLFPVITTTVTDIGSNAANLVGDISNISSLAVTSRGFEISISPNFSNAICTLNNSTTGSGTFDVNTYAGYPISSCQLLSPNTTYYARTVIGTENGIRFFGNVVSFTTLNVGQAGPAGGIVFFDKGNNVGGWQYLEAAPVNQSNSIAWGCNGTSIFSGFSGQLIIGGGQSNTSTIVANCNDASFAAKSCDNLVLGGQSDWFLPSYYELQLMIQTLNLSGIYWSSTETSSPQDAWGFDLSGPQYLSKTSLNNVRAIRAY